VGLLSLESMQAKQEDHSEKVVVKYQKEFDYVNRPQLKTLPVMKRAAKRHFGVHGYFTKQS